MKLIRENTGYLDYTVYRQPTHADRYLNFRSDHPLQHKKAVIKTLLCRAERLTSSEVNYKEEINHVQLALKNNGYPSALTTLSQIWNNTKKMIANRSSVVLPYYRGLSEKLQRCLSDHKIKAFFKPMRTIGDKLRNRTPLLESPFALMNACCQLAETLVSFLLSQQLSEEDFYYYLSCWLVLQYVKHHCCNEATYSWCFCTDIIFFTVINKKIARYL